MSKHIHLCEAELTILSVVILALTSSCLLEISPFIQVMQIQQKRLLHQLPFRTQQHTGTALLLSALLSATLGHLCLFMYKC